MPRPCCYATGLRSYFHQTIRPRPTPSTPPRKTPKIAATTIAATYPSRRSNRPPWPGMMWLEFLKPKRGFTADSKRLASWDVMYRTAPKNRAGQKPADGGPPDDPQDEHQRDKSVSPVEPPRDRGNQRREGVAAAK